MPDLTFELTAGPRQVAVEFIGSDGRIYKAVMVVRGTNARVAIFLDLYDGLPPIGSRAAQHSDLLDLSTPPTHERDHCSVRGDLPWLAGRRKRGLFGVRNFVVHFLIRANSWPASHGLSTSSAGTHYPRRIGFVNGAVWAAAPCAWPITVF